MRIKSLIFHTIILGTIIGVFSLGVWQLQRREWKHALIAQYDHQANQPAVAFNKVPNDIHSWEWRNVYVKGKLDNSKHLYIPKYFEICGPARWGQWTYGLLTLPSGEKVILEIGWQVSQKIDPEKSPDFHFPDANPYGAEIVPITDHPFLSNRPEKNQWFYVDADMYRAFGAAPRNFYLRLNAETMHTCDQIENDYSVIRFPLEIYGKPNFSDNHLQYAITWFALAAVLSALYLYKISHDRRN